MSQSHIQGLTIALHMSNTSSEHPMKLYILTLLHRLEQPLFHGLFFLALLAMSGCAGMSFKEYAPGSDSQVTNRVSRLSPQEAAEVLQEYIRNYKPAGGTSFNAMFNIRIHGSEMSPRGEVVKDDGITLKKPREVNPCVLYGTNKVFLANARDPYTSATVDTQGIHIGYKVYSFELLPKNGRDELIAIMNRYTYVRPKLLLGERTVQCDVPFASIISLKVCDLAGIKVIGFSMQTDCVVIALWDKPTSASFFTAELEAAATLYCTHTEQATLLAALEVLCTNAQHGHVPPLHK